jgi:hypothetical protein
MFILVENNRQKRAAQTALERNLKRVLKRQGMRNIGHPGGNFDEVLYSRGAGTLWAAVGRLSDEDAIARYWNGFGVYWPNMHHQDIVVEINVPIERNTAQIAGFFARDSETGQVFLMHTGKVGGGQSGIGKKNFLVHSRAKLVDVAAEDGRPRRGVVIGDVNATDLCSRIWQYVLRVQRFKEDNDAGKLSTAAFKRRVAEFDRYSREFSGKKSGSNGGSFEYITYHGDVVDALYNERCARAKRGEEVFNSSLIDLFVKKNGKLTEVYEVKTGTERQTLYTAIGQLVTHSIGISSPTARFLVVPASGDLAPDFVATIKAQRIQVRRFRLAGPARERRVILE